MSREDWRQFQSSGIFAGSGLDRADGFIHLSTKHQVSGTLQRYFQGRDDQVLVSLDPEKLESNLLKWEISRDNEKFPHYYADLPLGAVGHAHDLKLDRNGKHIIPL